MYAIQSVRQTFVCLSVLDFSILFMATSNALCIRSQRRFLISIHMDVNGAANLRLDWTMQKSTWSENNGGCIFTNPAKLSLVFRSAYLKRLDLLWWLKQWNTMNVHGKSGEPSCSCVCQRLLLDAFSRDKFTFKSLTDKCRWCTKLLLKRLVKLEMNPFVVWIFLADTRHNRIEKLSVFVTKIMVPLQQHSSAEYTDQIVKRQNYGKHLIWSTMQPGVNQSLVIFLFRNFTNKMANDRSVNNKKTILVPIRFDAHLSQ